MKSCFFIGHRDSSEDIFPMLEREIERHIVEYGVEEFIVGQYGRFDGMAARAVQGVKGRYPRVQLILLLAYLRNEALPEGFDGCVFPDGLEFVPKKYAILRANQRMIDRCDHLIAHVQHPFGGACQCLAYAEKKHLRIALI